MKSEINSFYHFAARLFIRLLGINHTGQFWTAVQQNLKPVLKIATKHGPLFSLGGHEQLRWRTLSFFKKEEDTINWLESLAENDVLWDVGANNGLYSVYANLVAKCKVIAVEPESQNFALLIQNIAINNCQGKVWPLCVALSDSFSIGTLLSNSLGKGVGFNQFEASPLSISKNVKAKGVSVDQIQVAFSIDDLVELHGLPQPTHLKIDVDGIEPRVVKGAIRAISNQKCRSILIEIQKNDAQHIAAIKILEDAGFSCISELPNWKTLKDKGSNFSDLQRNMIFMKAPAIL